MTITGPSRLLIADGDAETTAIVAAVASGQGFEVRTAETEAEALRLLDDWRPSLLIMDVILNLGDGISLLRQLSAHAPKTSVIMVSGCDQRLLQAARFVATSHHIDLLVSLAKPVEVKDLEAWLKRAATRSLVIDEASLGTAIQNGELVVYYQPKVDLTHSHIRPVVGVEALVRWLRPGGELVPPDRFIPLAESCPLIRPLTDAVVRQVLDQSRKWDAEGIGVPIAVNLSARLLEDLDYPERFAMSVADAGVSPDRIVLEITETAIAGEGSSAIEVMMRLRLKGFEISLDDFGTGYSSLVQTYRMPFDELKIDQCFIKDSDESRNARSIIRASIEMAHDLGMRVCAEGVETQSSVEYLRSLGCEMGQGYLFSKPLSADNATEFLRASKIAAKPGPTGKRADRRPPPAPPGNELDDAAGQTILPASSSFVLGLAADGAVPDGPEGATLLGVRDTRLDEIRNHIDEGRPYHAISAGDKFLEALGEAESASPIAEAIRYLRARAADGLAITGSAVVVCEGNSSVLLNARSILIGREAAGTFVDLPVGCRLLSRGSRQTWLGYDDGLFRVRDLGSKNGTLLDDVLLEQNRPTALDRSRAGFRLSMGGRRDPATPGPCQFLIRRIDGEMPSLVLTLDPDPIAHLNELGHLEEIWPSWEEDAAITWIINTAGVLIGPGEECAVRVQSESASPFAAFSYDGALHISRCGDDEITVGGAVLRSPMPVGDATEIRMGSVTIGVHAMRSTSRPQEASPAIEAVS